MSEKKNSVGQESYLNHSGFKDLTVRQYGLVKVILFHRSMPVKVSALVKLIKSFN